MPNRPTLKTIAQIAGLSHVAVSKALRDAPDISGATKERVKKSRRSWATPRTWPPGTSISSAPAPSA